MYSSLEKIPATEKIIPAQRGKSSSQKAPELTNHRERAGSTANPAKNFCPPNIAAQVDDLTLGACGWN